jgi:hypothetical protein
LDSFEKLDEELSGGLKDIIIKFLRSDSYKFWRAEEAARVVALEACILCGEDASSTFRALNRSESSNELLRPYPTDASSGATSYCVKPFELESIVNNHPWLFSFIVAIETLPIAMSIATLNTDVDETQYPLVYVNKHFQWLVKYPREYIVGQKSSFCFIGTDILEDGITYEKKLRESMESCNMVEGLYITKSQDGKKFRNFIVAKPMSNRDWICKYFITIHHNVEELMRQEDDKLVKSFLSKMCIGSKLMRSLPLKIPEC